MSLVCFTQDATLCSCFFYVQIGSNKYTHINFQKSFLACLLCRRICSPYYPSSLAKIFLQEHVLQGEPHPIQHERYRNKSDCQKPQRRTRPRHPQILIHRRREQRKPSPKRRPHEIVPRQHTRRVLRIRIREIIQHGVEEQKRPDGKPPRSNNRHDPMDVRARRPAEPEQADGDAKSADERRGQPFLGLEFAVFVELRLHHFVEIVEERGDDEGGAEEDADEGEAFFAKVELVDPREDDGEGFEPDV